MGPARRGEAGFRDADGFETADVELDGTYEAWGSAQAGGPVIHIDHLGPTGPAFDDINVQVAHHYNDTFSVRAGGAYNTKLSFGVLALRAGAFYDKSATSDNPATRAWTSTRSTRSRARWAWASSGAGCSST